MHYFLQKLDTSCSFPAPDFILDFAWVALHDSSVRIMLISLICLKQAVLAPRLLSQTKILNSRWEAPLSTRVPYQELTLEWTWASFKF